MYACNSLRYRQIAYNAIIPTCFGRVLKLKSIMQPTFEQEIQSTLKYITDVKGSLPMFPRVESVLKVLINMNFK